jgi:cytoskeletal protein CcmA (bactofilin family)
VFKRRKPDDVPATEPSLTVPPPGEGAPDIFAAVKDDPSDLTAQQGDSGLGVPPFRPAPSKEAPPMGRSPFGINTANPGTPSVGPGGVPSRSVVAPSRPPVPTERRTLVVGRGISLQGTVQDAERLVVEGTVEASLIHAAELSVAPGGMFKGEVEVEDAEVAGTIDGTLTARGNLIVRASGRLLGTARCRRLQVEDGGQITGRIEMLTDAVPAPVPAEQG